MVSALDSGLRVRALDKDIVLCCWARTLYSYSASLHLGGVYMGTGKFNAGVGSISPLSRGMNAGSFPEIAAGNRAH